MKNGKVSESVLKRSVLRQLKTKNENVICGAGVGDDCAIFALSDTAKLASCMQEGVICVPPEQTEGTGTDCISMSHLIQKCINNLAVSGANPFAVTIALILPETLEEPQLKAIMAEAEGVCKAYAEACCDREEIKDGLDKAGIQIAGGQTRVSSAVNAPVAVVTGYGKIVDNDYYTAVAAKSGQDIVISKWIGLEGTVRLARKYRQQLLSRYPAYLVEEAAGFDRYLSIVPEAATAMKSGVCAMHDASEGGIFGALWELAEGAGVGLTIDLKKLPLRQETVEVCECCNVNPYELQSGGSLVMTTEDGLGLVAALEAVGIPAVVVGKLTDSNDRIIINEDEVRYMDRPRAK